MSDTTLILADGTTFCGTGFGYCAPSYNQLFSLAYDDAPLGEVVFNTTMGAYHEIITDPSYAGQSIVMTSVHIGNYGMETSWDEMYGITPACRSLIVREMYDGPVQEGRISLDEQCRLWHLCGLQDVDTRALTHHVRDHGSMYGVLLGETGLRRQQIESVVSWIEGCPPMEARDFVSPVCVTEPCDYQPDSDKQGSYALWDFGVKRSIVKQLLAHGISVTVYPCSMDLDEILTNGHGFDALFLSNGPGDPDNLDAHVLQIRDYIGSIPILGICLGHQLIAKAMGSKTEKMLFGHHGGNHPVRDLQTGNVYVTAQNHGYCVRSETLPTTAEAWLVNDNDGSLEGFYDTEQKVMAVQFHPEASPGPWEARRMFPRFIDFVSPSHTHSAQEEYHHAR